MLNSSSNFPSHTHTRWLSHLILGVLLVFPANPDGSVSTIAVYSSRLWPCLCRTGRGSPVPTHLSHQYIQTLAPLVSSAPPPAVGVGYVPKIPHAPHLLAEVGDVADDLASALFSPLWAGVTRAQLSLVKERENHRRNIRKRRRGAETCSRQTSTDQKPVKSLFSL